MAWPTRTSTLVQTSFSWLERAQPLSRLSSPPFRLSRPVASNNLPFQSLDAGDETHTLRAVVAAILADSSLYCCGPHGT